VNILLRLVNQILDFRKYENGKMEYTPVTVDVAQCLVRQQMFYRIGNQCQRSTEVVRNIGEEYQLGENGKMEYTPVTVDVLSSFEGWNESFQAAARKKHMPP